MEGINFAGKDTVIWPQGEWHTFNKIITDVQPSAAVLLRMDGPKCTKDGKGTNCGGLLQLQRSGRLSRILDFRGQKRHHRVFHGSP